ncbi:MAG: hypothetical protein LBF85_05085 [Tannerella sp.]|jgi:hypothetical protein|nr:hypothetical protein [Tannerella sp.]
MSGKDYIPRQDGKFLEWAQKLLIYVKLYLEVWGISELVYGAVKTLLDNYDSAYGRVQESNRDKVDVRLKNETRDALKASIRRFVKEHLQYNSAVTNADRENMDLPIHGAHPAQPHIPTSTPVGEIDASLHLQHIIHVKDEKRAGRAKPPEAHGFEVWYKIGGGPPASDCEWSHARFSTRSPLIIKFPLFCVGKTVYYRFRWVNSRNQPGPWNENFISAVIA